ncbi:MAG TPA: GTP 3',8-cyclase MoaA, partial [Acidobacteriota bacterium]|nr:GTP 3',8-cyclase MoaA [Acidobacteriota bacterium]
MLIDRFGRIANDLRISVTDRCNYRCVYCMPAHVEWLPKPEILTFEEIEFLTRIFAAEGVTEIRLTGGEPLVRRDLPVLISKLFQVPGIKDISLTTNGFYLKEQALTLRDAGIRRINVSLDSLRPERFQQITRSNAFDRVMEGIREAQRAGFDPIKINCVAIRGFNDDEIVDFLRWGAENRLQIRFIEFMPLDGDHNWKLANVLTQAEILEKVKELAVQPVAQAGAAPAAKFSYGAGGAEFGVIASVSEPFCAHCSRIRLTADGKLRNCLFALTETDLKTPLRAGANAEELVALMRAAVYTKWAGHKINAPDFAQPAR